MRFIPTTRQVVLFLIAHAPRWLAQPAIVWAAAQNHEEGPSCPPCAAHTRLKRDAHNETVGPYSNYCSKCGLDIMGAPKYCANRVKKINNPETKPSGYVRVYPMFWED